MPTFFVSSLIFFSAWVLYICTASSGGYGLDGGEFVAQGIELGISHPPGHPLQGLWGYAWSLLPFGPLAFRITMGCAAATAFSAVLLYRSGFWLHRAICGDAPEPRAVLTGITLAAAVLCPGVWFQAIRPEVYALQGCISAALFERLLCAAHLSQLSPQDSSHSSEQKCLIQAVLFAGIGLCNHHFSVVIVWPILLAMTWPALSRGIRPWAILTLCGAAAGTIYGYMLLRSGTIINFVRIRSLGDLFFTVSAKVFQKNAGHVVPEPWMDRIFDVLTIFIDNFYFTGLVLVLLGLYVAWRAVIAENKPKDIPLLFTLGVTLPMLGRVLLGFNRSNPDAHGYLLLSFFSIAGLIAGVIARLPHVIGSIFAVGFILHQLMLPKIDALPLSLRAFHDAETIATRQLSQLPNDTRLILYQPNSIFRLWGFQAEEMQRPDVEIIDTPFLGYPNRKQWLASVDLSFLQQTPTFGGKPWACEMDPRVDQTLFPDLQPLSGFIYWPSAMRVDSKMSDPEDSEWSDTQTYLMWNYYMRAIWAAAIGRFDIAQQAIHACRRIQPKASHVIVFSQALDDAQRRGVKRLDISPFIAF